MSAIKQPPGTSVDYLTYQPPQQKGSESFSTVPEKVLELTLSISSWVMCLSLNQSLWQNGRNMLMSQSYLSGRWGGGGVGMSARENQIADTGKIIQGKGGGCLCSDCLLFIWLVREEPRPEQYR